MKIAVFSPDLPYPPNRGGRADIWRRIEAFRSLGHEVMLVNLQEPSGVNAPTPAALQHVDAVLNRRFSFPIKRGIFRTVRQLLMSWLIPWHAATRTPDPAEKQALFAMLKQFSPDMLWLDGPWFAVSALEAKRRYGVPLLYRSHNIEHRYLRGQARAAVKLRDRLAWTLVCLGLHRFERNTMRQADAIFDISVDDLHFWKSAGLQNMHWLPPLPEAVFRKDNPVAIPGELVFIGNLGTPNNVRGVQWLVTEVLPIVRRRLPLVQCRIIGSNPTTFIRELLVACPSVELCANVPDPAPYLLGAKVLVNPVMTGSGVQVKMLDMLMSDAPIVTTSQGTRGLPPEFKTLFRVADHADAFAEAICEELRQPSVDPSARARARRVFSVNAVGEALKIAARVETTNGKS